MTLPLQMGQPPPQVLDLVQRFDRNRPSHADNAADKAARDRIAELAEQMLASPQRLAAARTPQEKTALERQIAATDTQFPALNPKPAGN